MISRSTIDKVEALDLSQVIGRQVPLKRHGHEDEGNCPFTNHSTKGGFLVNDRKGVYKCFKCGEGGKSAVQFVMKTQSLSFPEAVMAIARDHGIAVEFEAATNGYDPESWKRKQEERESVFTILEQAQQEFRLRMALEENKHAVEYLESRGFSAASVNDWGFGYAGGASHWANNPALFDEELYMAAGLVSKGESNYDTFIRRITLPLLDDRGRICGFAGRSMDPQPKAKWINSKNNDTYQKGAFLFGLFQAKKAIKSANGVVYLTEGYPNVIRAHEQGVENIVAASGTSFTVEQARLLKHYANIVIYLPDPDNAGEKAMWRHVPTLLGAGMDVRFCFPNGDTPAWQGLDLDDLGKLLQKEQVLDPEDGTYSGPLLGDLVKNHVHWLDHKLDGMKDLDLTNQLFAHEFIADAIAAMPSDSARAISMDTARKGGVSKIKTMVNHRLKEQAQAEKELRAKDQEANGVQIDETGCYAWDKKGNKLQVTHYQIKLRYQLPKAEDRNDSEWVLQAWTPERVVHIRVDNATLSSARSFMSVFRNHRIEMTIDDTQLGRLIQFLMKEVKVAEKVDILGFHPKSEIMFFANMAYDVTRREKLYPNELSIIDHPGGACFYMPYCDPKQNPSIYKSSFAYRDSSFTLTEFAGYIAELWGEKAMLVLGLTIGGMFADFLSRAANPMQPFFPLGFLKGAGGSGKSTLAKMMSFFFTSMPQSIDLGMKNTEASMGKIMASFRNAPVVLDDYGKKKATIDDLSAFFNSIFGRVGYSKTDSTDVEETKTYDVNAWGLVTSNINPVDETGALQQRFIWMNFDSNVRTAESMNRFARLTELIGNQSLTPITLELLNHRQLVKDNFGKEYEELTKKFKNGTKDTEVPDRILKNYALALLPFYLMLKHRLVTIAGMDAVKLTKMAEENIIRQHMALMGKSVLAQFWEIVQDSVDAGYLKEGTHYKVLASLTDKAGGQIIEEPVLSFRWPSFYNSYLIAAKRMGLQAQPEQGLKYEMERHGSWLDELSKCNAERFRPTEEESKAGKKGVTSAIRIKYLPIRQEFLCNLTGTQDSQL